MATTQGRTKICHLVYSFHVGGLERVVVNCVNSMDASQFEHSIIALTSVGEFVEQFSVPVQHYSLNKKSGTIFRFITGCLSYLDRYSQMYYTHIIWQLLSINGLLYLQEFLSVFTQNMVETVMIRKAVSKSINT